MSAPRVYCTTYCNFGHNVTTGRPIGHQCRIIPPKALLAEMSGDYAAAVEILRSTPAVIAAGRKVRGAQ
jgi:hypothetical protein